MMIIPLTCEGWYSSNIAKFIVTLKNYFLLMWQADIREQLWCLVFQIQGGRLSIFRNFIIPSNLIWTPRLLVFEKFSNILLVFSKGWNEFPTTFY